jgi:MFS family permease
VVGALFIILTLNAGITFYGLSAYITALTDHGKFSLTDATIGPSIAFGTAGITGLFVARLLTSVDIRVVMVVGVALTGLMLALIGYVETRWELWGLFLVFGFGSAGFSLLPASTMVVRWFPASPSQPMAIMSTGFGVGGTLIPPILSAVIGRLGLAYAAMLFGAVLLAAVTALTLVLVRNPQGYAPQAKPALHGPRDSAERLLPALSRRAFVFIGIAYMFFFMSQVGLVTHMLSLGRDRHVEGALALSALAISGLVFRIAGIPFVSRFGLRVFTLTFASIQVASLLVLALAFTTPLLIVGAIMFGSTIGNLTVSLPLNVHRAFGTTRFAQAYARLSLVATVGTTAAPALVGALRTNLGDYGGALLLIACGSLVGAVLLAMLPRATDIEVPVNPSELADTSRVAHTSK